VCSLLNEIRPPFRTFKEFKQLFSWLLFRYLWNISLTKLKDDGTGTIMTSNVHQGCTVVWWLVLSHHSKSASGLNLSWGLSVWSVNDLIVYAWVLSGYSGFLPAFKNMHVRLIEDSKLSESDQAWLFVSVWAYDGLVTCPGCTLSLAQWQPQIRLSVYRKWMDGKCGSVLS